MTESSAHPWRSATRPPRADCCRRPRSSGALRPHSLQRRSRRGLAPGRGSCPGYRRLTAASAPPEETGPVALLLPHLDEARGGALAGGRGDDEVEPGAYRAVRFVAP